MADKPDLVPVKRTRRLQQGEKLRDGDKVERIPVKVIASDTVLRKPDWIRVKVPASKEVDRIKSILRSQKLSTVCEEASCPNLGECFSGGTATFMIMGKSAPAAAPSAMLATVSPTLWTRKSLRIWRKPLPR